MTTYERRRYGGHFHASDLTCQHCGMLPSVHKRWAAADGTWDGSLLCLTDEEVLADLQRWQREGRVSLEGRGPVTGKREGE